MFYRTERFHSVVLGWDLVVARYCGKEVGRSLIGQIWARGGMKNRGRFLAVVRGEK